MPSKHSSAAASASTEKRHGVLALLRLTAFTTIVSLLAAAVLALVAVPRVTGSQTYTILTGSMQPGLPPGTVIVTQPRSFEKIQPGDVVTYQLHSGKPEVVTHRVIGLSTDTRGARTLVLRGDANTSPDPAPVISAQVRGVVIYAVPYAGLVISTMTSTATTWVPVLIGVLMLLWGAGYVVAHVRERRKRAATTSLLPEGDGAAA